MFFSILSGMKYVSSLKRICQHCLVVRRGRYQGIRCWLKPKHNQMQRSTFKKDIDKIGYGRKK